MLFTNQTVEENEIKSIANFFEAFDSEIQTVDADEVQEESCVSKYISSLVCGQYQKSVEDIDFHFRVRIDGEWIESLLSNDADGQRNAIIQYFIEYYCSYLDE